jgi:two-component system chemotaxis response regulator CheY
MADVITRQSRVLLVDDFAVVRMMLKRYLEEIGLTRIDEASNGAEALHMIKEAQQLKKQYGIVFLDWSMPKMTGIAVLQECRRHPEYKDLPILLVTAESERKQVLKAVSLGANDYVVKPFTLETVRAKIEQLNKQLAKKS